MGYYLKSQGSSEDQNFYPTVSCQITLGFRLIEFRIIKLLQVCALFENTFHARVNCPKARPLHMALRYVQNIPGREYFQVFRAKLVAYLARSV